jgi:hypothetical protein
VPSLDEVEEHLSDLLIFGGFRYLGRG